ncbi:chemotaxis protein [Vibrio cidicii]|uniref:chemotaxis protein n=1 Tax=Vibrio TaxID=662 RepID=UPI00338F391C
MRMEGLILDASDVTQETKRDYTTGEEKLHGKLNLITTNPTSTIEVRIAPELWRGGEAGKLLTSLVGKRTMFDVEFKKMSFGNEQGKHVEIQSFQLYQLPDSSK